MLNIDFLANDYGRYGILCEGVQQARALWDAVKERWPERTENWRVVGPPNDPGEFAKRIFLFVGGKLVHGSPIGHSYLDVTLFEKLCISELPDFEANAEVMSLFS